jgi:hypothetical protein
MWKVQAWVICPEISCIAFALRWMERTATPRPPHRNTPCLALRCVAVSEELSPPAGDIRRRVSSQTVDLMASLHEHRQRGWRGTVLCRRAGDKAETEATRGPVRMCEKYDLITGTNVSGTRGTGNKSRCVRKCYALFYYIVDVIMDRLCGLVVRVPGYRSEARVRFPALPDFLRSSGSGTGSTQLREYN